MYKATDISAQLTNRPGRIKIHVFLSTDTVLSHLIDRHHKPHEEYRKDIIPEVLKSIGLPESVHVHWSQKAECQCGCSPGFVISKQERSGDVFVTAALAPKEKQETV